MNKKFMSFIGLCMLAIGNINSREAREFFSAIPEAARARRYRPYKGYRKQGKTYRNGMNYANSGESSRRRLQIEACHLTDASRGKPLFA